MKTRGGFNLSFENEKFTVPLQNGKSIFFILTIALIG
jgi:hypothetical protein